MDTVVGRECLFKNDDKLTTKSILIDHSITKSCGDTVLDRATRRSGNATCEAANVKNINTGELSPLFLTTFFRWSSQRATR